ncbi:hypothetical protein A1507_19805 [Methylomonas koyamae]|uniref:TIR domain-containing protein n=1 Tax=Methylomonas koyamae TaxID=702114 RepID=A0A177N1N1_9GAMM|nr:toll/interleukin-1 receptor domain-containing protein [Methylomonas koyamae]OAI11775.1 hypothetical protein A1507_19805 [Methylomonas koyamae]
MAKAFLSHNSFDKDFVGSVFEILGAAKAIYDKVTFRKNCDLVVQIEEGLEDSEVYVLFLSQASLHANWVKSEMDLAHELKIRWKIKKFLVFQLDETSWEELPAWLSRYVVSCPPSPQHVALRILDELSNANTNEKECYGRENVTKEIVKLILEKDEPPAFLYLSGPKGIGRRTLASEVFKTIYSGVSTYKHKVIISLEHFDDLTSLYRKLLSFSSNWRARDLINTMDEFAALNDQQKTIEIATLMHKISVSFRQVLIIDLGVSALDEEGGALPWFSQLLQILPNADYPYVWFISQRYLSESICSNGIFFPVEPLDSEDSRYLFKLLLNNNKITFPSKKEKEYIETCIVGHPGLIEAVVNYLRINPNYKPNKTYNSILQLISKEVEQLLLDFIKDKAEIEKAVSLLGEAYILSYEEVLSISEVWPEFTSAISLLLDAGFVLRSIGDYQLVPYVQRYASSLADRYARELREPRKVLLEAYDKLADNSFVPINLLDVRIVEHILTDEPISGVLKSLVMPTQQLKAARRKYDAQEYSVSLRLSLEAYDQARKLSENGVLEAWRLIGLSSIRENDIQKFDFFTEEYKSVPSGSKRDEIFYFAKGFKCRQEGNLRDALSWFKKITNFDSANSHVYRELAYIYAFEEDYEEALNCINIAAKITPSSPYVLDIKSLILLEKYKQSKKSFELQELDQCLEQLHQADLRDDTNFWNIRFSTRDILINGDSNSLLLAYQARNSLGLHAKVNLLRILSIKGKNDQYDQLKKEIFQLIRKKKNNLAKIELDRIEIEHCAVIGKTREAKEILDKNRINLTDRCISNLESIINHYKAYVS